MKVDRKALIKRILANTSKEGDCLIWNGGNSGLGNGAGRGYGRISVNGYTCAVHRVLFVCLHGFVPAKVEIDHTCGNRLCVAPAHLQAVSHKENCKRRNKRNNGRKRICQEDV